MPDSAVPRTTNARLPARDALLAGTEGPGDRPATVRVPAEDASEVTALILEGETDERSPAGGPRRDPRRRRGRGRRFGRRAHTVASDGRSTDARRSSSAVAAPRRRASSARSARSCVAAGQILVLIGLAFFIAVGLDPPVAWLHRRGLPRWAAVIAVLSVALGIFGGFLALAVPLLITQGTRSPTSSPLPAQSATTPHVPRASSTRATTSSPRSRSSSARAAPQRSPAESSASARSSLDLIGAVVVVLILSIYLLADLPRVKRGIYQLAPQTPPRAWCCSPTRSSTRIGGYVLGNLLTSFIAGFGTWAWALTFGIPYALLLGLLVALLDLIPMVGSTIGGIIVSLVALTVSLPIAIATAIFYFVYRFLEDYLLTPKIMARTVQVPGLLTVVATVIGGTLLGIIGALIAIPIAAAIKLLLDEPTIPSLNRR